MREFKEWLSMQPVEKLNKMDTEKIFKSFAASFIMTHFEEIALAVYEVEKKAKLNHSPVK